MSKPKQDPPKPGDTIAIPDDVQPVAEGLDPRDAEITRLKDELAAAKTGLPVFASGKRYRVSVQDGPSWVVEPKNGEHPFEAYKAATGVLNSQNAPEIVETELPVGRAA